MTTLNKKLIPLSRPEQIGLGVGRRSLGRRIKNPPAGFPQVIEVNGRKHLEQTALEAYKAMLIRGAVANTSPTDPPVLDELDRLRTYKQAAEILNVGYHVVQRAARRGLIPVYRVGNSRPRVTVGDFVRLMSRDETG